MLTSGPRRDCVDLLRRICCRRPDDLVMTDHSAQQDLPAGLHAEQLCGLVDLALREDLARRGDITVQIAALPDQPQRYALTAKQQGLFVGQALLAFLLHQLAPAARLGQMGDRPDALPVTPGRQIALIESPPKQMLPAERTLLNFLGRLSGVATLTARYVAAVAGTAAKIYDTRKTIPGWRQLDKYAVRSAGGCNHRMGLYDAILLKDNHLAGLAIDQLAPRVADMVRRARQLKPAPAFIEVEVDDLDQLAKLLPVTGIDVILLDNFSLSDLARAVHMRNDAGLADRLELEASGNITLENVRAVAETGLERISIGALTHSAPALDLSLEAI